MELSITNDLKIFLLTSMYNTKRQTLKQKLFRTLINDLSLSNNNLWLLFDYWCDKWKKKHWLFRFVTFKLSLFRVLTYLLILHNICFNVKDFNNHVWSHCQYTFLILINFNDIYVPTSDEVCFWPSIKIIKKRS